MTKEKIKEEVRKLAKVKISGYRCERCGHTWVPRGKEQPTVCPKCKSPYWNRAKKKK